MKVSVHQQTTPAEEKENKIKNRKKNNKNLMATEIIGGMIEITI